ncbi:MAG: UDP-N-acetylmuramoyl-L-alanine--D-glutamate ligase [Anaerolineales bacterium]|nr:UDP-N-acetylmuramoyl-L-alanine--D-glutamate ligase [Anaerolineales bacterium]
MTNWNGSRALILGAARQGIALARWLSRHGSNVTLSDARHEDELISARASLADTNVQWAIGGHPLELLDNTDVLCISGGVPLTLPIVQEAIKRGIPLSNDTQIFMEAVPCKTIGITGSAGKTTTTTLVGKMAEADYGQQTVDRENLASTIHRPRSFVGGNIGDPLINYVDDMKADDIAILEISSFQLEQMTISPNISAILNITPNHLDRHGTMDAYTNAKAHILEFQTDKDTAILSHDDKGAWNLRDKVKGELLTFSLKDLDEGLNGAYLHDRELKLRDGNTNLSLLPREKIQLRGDHNVSNVLAAFTIGHAAGFKTDAMLKAVEEFRGVAHRLELVRELHGVRWYNGSIATAPERSMADIHAFDEPIVLMLGGRDKDLPWDEIAKLIHKRVDHVVLFGEAAELIQKAVTGVGGREARSVDICCAKNLKEAIVKAAEVASAGDIVLFSPGGTSYDEFKDFAERGEAFRKWVLELS